MRTPNEPTERDLVLPPKPAPAPKPQPEATHVHGSIWRKPDGMLETQDYPRAPEPAKAADDAGIGAVALHGWPCLYSDAALAVLDAWEC